MFDFKNFSPVGAVSSLAPTIFTYFTEDDLTEVIAQGYFENVAVKDDDIIFCSIGGIVYEMFYSAGAVSVSNDAKTLEKAREIYVNDAANPANASLSLGGKSATYPVHNLVTADSLAQALVPPPTLGNGASISDTSYSRYIGGLDFTDNVQVFLPASTIVGEVGAGAAAGIDVSTILTSGLGSECCYNSKGKSRIGLDAKALVANGVGDCCYKVTGATDETYARVGQALVRADNSFCIDYDSSGEHIEGIDIEVLDMGDDTTNPSNCHGILFAGTGSKPVDMDIGKIKSNSTNLTNTGVRVNSGHLILSETSIDVDDSETAIYVQNGAKLTITSPYVNGVIFVEVGGELVCDITEHDKGDLFLLGTVNGTINFVDYGSAIDGNNLSNNYELKGAIKNQENDIGHLSFDAATDTITQIWCNYYQTVNENRTVNVQVVDANDTLTVYWSKSVQFNTIGFQPFGIDLVNDEVTPIPSTGRVDLLFLVNKSGGQGTFNFNMQVERTRT